MVCIECKQAICVSYMAYPFAQKTNWRPAQTDENNLISWPILISSGRSWQLLYDLSLTWFNLLNAIFRSYAVICAPFSQVGVFAIDRRDRPKNTFGCSKSFLHLNEVLFGQLPPLEEMERNLGANFNEEVKSKPLKLPKCPSPLINNKSMFWIEPLGLWVPLRQVSRCDQMILHS